MSFTKKIGLAGRMTVVVVESCSAAAMEVCVDFVRIELHEIICCHKGDSTG